MKRMLIVGLVITLLTIMAIPVAAFADTAGTGSASAIGPSSDRTLGGEAHPGIHLRPGATTSSPKGYTPSQIRTAYGFAQLSNNGAGQTIAIVDAYGSPTIQKDLNTFDTAFGLANITVNIVNQASKIPTNSGWALETSLDVEWAHAIAPNATIMLVVARSASLSDLIWCVDYATTHGANVVSMSWGAREFSGESSYDSHFNHTGVIYVASSGDSGSIVEWPAVSPYVVAVGGTTLNLQANGTYVSETAWSGSGGGKSSYVPKPTWQNGFQTSSKRGVPDVAYVANPSTGVAMYDSTPYQKQSGWFVIGGTSVGAPSWAALFALSGSGSNTALYGLATSNWANYYHDITPSRYDFVTGLGSPQANNLVPALATK